MALDGTKPSFSTNQTVCFSLINDVAKSLRSDINMLKAQMSSHLTDNAVQRRRVLGACVLLTYALLYTCFAVGSSLVPVVVGKSALSPGDKAWLALSAIAGAFVAIYLIFFFTGIKLEWQTSWKRYGLLFILGSAVDGISNYLTHSSWLGVPNHALILVLTGVANVGMLFAAVGIGLIVAQGMRQVNYLVMAAIVAAATDIISVFMGPTKHLITTDAFAYLSFQWGILGLGDISPIIGMGDFIFLALFFTGVRKFGWAAHKTLYAMCFALAIGLLSTLYGPRALPALPFMAVALLITHVNDIKQARVLQAA